MNYVENTKYLCRSLAWTGSVTVFEVPDYPTRAACFAAKYANPALEKFTVRVRDERTGKRSVVTVESYVERHWRVAKRKGKAKS